MAGNASPEMVNRMLMAYMLQEMKKPVDISDKAMTGQAAFRRLHKLKARVADDPNAIVTEYIEEVMDQMGLEPGDA
jgi:hypothetical protein